MKALFLMSVIEYLSNRMPLSHVCLCSFDTSVLKLNMRVLSDNYFVLKVYLAICLRSCQLPFKSFSTATSKKP